MRSSATTSSQPRRRWTIEEVVIAPRSPWQNPYVEQLIGSIRRECLDHMIVWNQRSLCQILHSYFHYYEGSRTHLALAEDAPAPRAVDQPENGRIEAISQVGGLHHRYQRRAASPSECRRRCQEHSPSSVFLACLEFAIASALYSSLGCFSSLCALLPRGDLQFAMAHT